MADAPKHSFLYRNGLSIVVLGAMLLFWAAQALTGWHDHNSELQDHGQAAICTAVILSPPLLKTGKASFYRWPFMWC